MKETEPIKIGGVPWTIASDPTTVDRLEENSDLGVTYPAKLRIAINTKVPEELQRETLLHEIIHAIQRTFLTSDAQMPEYSVKVFAAALYQVMVDNPAVVLFIMGYPSDVVNLIMGYQTNE